MRTDGDTWDIVSSVGATALGVAAARAMETAQPDALVRDEYAAWFVAASGHEGMNRWLADPARRESPLMSGMIGLRTRFYDDHFLTAGAAGVRQAVIVAAGLDARAYRLPWPAGTVVFELDQPKVLEFKRRVLDDHGATPAADRREVAVDLRDDWPAALLDAGFDPTVPTAWTAEGLLPYLPGAAQDSLFARIEGLSAPGSGLALDALNNYHDLDRVAEFQEHLRDTPLAEIDVRALFYTDDRTEPEDWFAARGWTANSLTVPELSVRYERELPPIPDPFRQMTIGSRYVTLAKPLTAPAA
ncbi:class I SAM-dependent methyltransferase [Nocardia sp. CDC159]|uniref:S-adenosyl-L-methionine-dependent methyltransferase n=1 Tax=Nocardia pulmonis TaxID=2951408 RepID=A0A9X2IYY6_9NOCA|nr:MULTISPECIES: class I SAM-dependent methyltransferase [Nocardia]MCM6774386.1 class I SAM-dependent methyltransferase [Nocardia pulmonis]MCM6787548.1 class I SAM-dependent methyltransferase [Nocardia sp. CDC159]